MSDRIYNKEDIQKRLSSYLEDNSLQLELWEKVQLLKKKDGSNFAIMSKSFNNATFTGGNGMTHPKITVYGYSVHGGYRSYDLDCYLYLDDMKKNNDPRYTGQPLTYNCLRATYCLNADEIFQRIQDHIVSLKARIKCYEDQLAALDNIFPVIDEKVQELKALVKDLTSPYKKDIYPSSLEYALYDYIRRSIR